MTSDDNAPSNAANEAFNPSLVTRPSSSRLARVTGLVLAGGMGRRMDSRDKGLVPFRGRPMVAHVIERPAPQVGSVLINANRNVEQYAASAIQSSAMKLAVLPARFAGLHAGMRAYDGADRHRAVRFTVPAARPCRPAACCDGERIADLAVVRTGGFAQPVFALYSTSLLPSLTTFLGERRPQD